MCRDAPHWGDCVEFWHAGDIGSGHGYKIRSIPRFRGFRILTPPIMPFSIALALAGRPYNSVSISDIDVDVDVVK